jgi:hypothetical protein
MPGLLRSLRAAFRGEVSAVELDARRRAGAAAYSLIEETGSAAGDDRGSRLFRLCAWNAFALQTIADTLIDVDSRDDPGTAGYVPRSTLQYANACLDEVASWIRCARVVQSDPAARLPGRFPSSLPAWHHDEPTTRIELHALRTAYEALEPRVESELEAFGRSAGAGRGRELAQLRRVLAEMASAAEYAAALLRPDSGPVDRGEARSLLLDALQHAFLLGQLLAVPTLVEVTRVRQDRADELPLSADASWLQIGPGWPVLDCDGVSIGRVGRVHGDRATGEFGGLEVDVGIGSSDLDVQPGAVARIGAGEITLSIRRDDLRA